MCSTGQACLEKPIERTRGRNHSNNFKTGQVLSGSRKTRCCWRASRVSIPRRMFNVSLRSRLATTITAPARRKTPPSVSSCCSGEVRTSAEGADRLHLHDLRFLVLEMIIDRFHEAIGEFLHFFLDIAKAVLG
jgi:hypothetical protein